MKQFIITEQQANAILTVLGDIPAKTSLVAIDILRSGLRVHEPLTGSGNINCDAPIQAVEG